MSVSPCVKGGVRAITNAIEAGHAAFAAGGRALAETAENIIHQMCQNSFLIMLTATHLDVLSMQGSAELNLLKICFDTLANARFASRLKKPA
jgi:hypothetical protein